MENPTTSPAHTPGPWFLVRVPHLQEETRAVEAAHGKRIAILKDGPDACLIEAAPDLLKAVNALLNTIGDAEYEEHDDIGAQAHDQAGCAICIARSARAKAEGTAA